MSSLATTVANLEKIARVPFSVDFFAYASTASAFAVCVTSLVALTSPRDVSVVLLMGLAIAWAGASLVYFVLVLRTVCGNRNKPYQPIVNDPQAAAANALVVGGYSGAAIEVFLYSAVSAALAVHYRYRYDGAGPASHEDGYTRATAFAGWWTTAGVMLVLSLSAIQPAFRLRVLTEAKMASQSR